MTITSVATTRRAQWTSLVVGLTTAAYLSWRLLQPFLNVLAWAAVMVILFQPVHRRLLARVSSPAWTALLSTSLVVVTVLVPVLVVVTAALRDVQAMADRLPDMMAGWLQPSHPFTGRAVAVLERYVDLGRWRDPAFWQRSLEQEAGQVASRSLWLVGGVLGMVVQAVLIVFTMFYLFKDGPRISRRLYLLVPIENRRLAALYRRTREVIEAGVYGTLLLSAIQGALGGLAFLVLGLPSPFVWGIVMTLAALIPMLGAFVVWVPAAIYLASTGSWWKALILTAWGGIAIAMVDNVLRPVLVGGRTQMHELLVFFGVLGGLQVFGVLGVVLGPAVFAVTLALVHALSEVRKGGPPRVPAA
jgi:predicted PurR-regulated permease PerM